MRSGGGCDGYLIINNFVQSAVVHIYINIMLATYTDSFHSQSASMKPSTNREVVQRNASMGSHDPISSAFLKRCNLATNQPLNLISDASNHFFGRSIQIAMSRMQERALKSIRHCVIRSAIRNFVSSRYFSRAEPDVYQMCTGGTSLY